MALSVRLSHGGRLSLPAPIRKVLGLEDGSVLLVELKGNTVQLTPMSKAIRDAQALVAPYRKPNVSVVDEFLEERRAEARRE